MELLRSQKNALLKSIKHFEFDPLNFEWDSIESEYNEFHFVPILKFKYSSYFFTIDNSSLNYYCCEYSPGNNHTITKLEAVEWDDVFGSFSSWLVLLKKEIEEPDLWEDIERIAYFDNMEYTSENTTQQFTYQEALQIESGINKIRNYLSEVVENNTEQLELVNESLDYLIDSSKRMGRKDWANIFYGAMASLSVSLALNPEQGRTMINLFKGAVAGIIKFIGTSGAM